MSQTGQFRQYAEERDSPRRRVSSPWKFTPPVQASEYHLINLATGVSHGGFETLSGARQRAREEGLAAWDIFHGNVRVDTTIRAVRPNRDKPCGQAGGEGCPQGAVEQALRLTNSGSKAEFCEASVGVGWFCV